MQDLRYSLRQLARSPGSTLTAVISLALGIGATTAVFSVIYAALINPYPYPAAGRIVRLTADLLNEAEHGADSAALLVTDSMAVVEAVDAELARQIAALPEPRASYARSALSDLGGAFLFDTLDEATAFAGDYAPEHMQIATRDPEAALAMLTYAGEVLLGQHSPVSAANFTIGVPATLPTGGFARINGGVTARTFMTTASVASLTADGLRSLAAPTLALADHEGFPAHANALRIRGLG